MSAADVVVTPVSETECTVAFRCTMPAVPVSLRRALLSEIPTLAITAVKVHHNDSFWARVEVERRLRMLPVVSAAAAQMQTVVRCMCLEGCGLCTVKLELDVTNTASAGKVCVFASEIKPGPEALAAGIRVADTGLDVPLVELMPGQRLCCTCVVRKGFGRNDAAFQACSAVGMAYAISVVVDPDAAAGLTPQERKDFADRCPKRVFDPDTLEPTGADRCDMCRACTDGCGDIEDVLVRARAGSVVSRAVPIVHLGRRTAEPTHSGQPRFPMRLSVNTTGALCATDALLLAASELKARLHRVAVALEETSAD